jgi:hypothetical protein
MSDRVMNDDGKNSGPLAQPPLASRAGEEPLEEMEIEIDTGRKKRFQGLLLYLLLFLAVSAALFYLLIQFSGSVALAVGLVGFMVGYMVLMSYWAGGKIRKRD